MSQKTARSSRAKGNLVEQIAAKMHAGPGVKVETQVRIAPRHGDTSRTKREIDILITASVAGYAVRIAIECKNEKKPIEASYIDAFVGKLQYVGISPQNGVYISVSPYTKGAQERADAEGIRLLNLTGLTEDRLSQEIHSAVQSVIHLLLQIDELSLTSTNGIDEEGYIPMVFFDSDKNLKGTLQDLVWRMWCAKKLPVTLGEYDIDVEIPEGWVQFAHGVPDPHVSLKAKVKVLGVVVTINGTATMNALINHRDKSVHKSVVSAEFTDIANSAPAYLHVIETEAELQEFVLNEKKDKFLHITAGKLLLPRVLTGTQVGLMFWPPSESALSKMESLFQQYAIGPGFDFSMLGDDPLDENSIEKVWDPISPKYLNLLQNVSGHVARTANP